MKKLKSLTFMTFLVERSKHHEFVGIEQVPDGKQYQLSNEFSYPQDANLGSQVIQTVLRRYRAKRDFNNTGG